MDLFLNRETRVHDDIEIGIYRKNQMQLYRFFGKDKKYYINNKSRIGKHEKLEWKKEYLRSPIHELYVERGGFELEILLNEADDTVGSTGGMKKSGSTDRKPFASPRTGFRT